MYDVELPGTCRCRIRLNFEQFYGQTPFDLCILITGEVTRTICNIHFNCMAAYTMMHDARYNQHDKLNSLKIYACKFVMSLVRSALGPRKPKLDRIQALWFKYSRRTSSS